MNQNWTNNKCWRECKNPKDHQFKKGYFWNPPKCSCKNGKYGRRIGDLIVMCDQIIEETKTIPTKSTSTKTIPPKTTATNLSILLAFLLITIASLITISIYLVKQ